MPKPAALRAWRTLNRVQQTLAIAAAADLAEARNDQDCRERERDDANRALAEAFDLWGVALGAPDPALISLFAAAPIRLEAARRQAEDACAAAERRTRMCERQHGEMRARRRLAEEIATRLHKRALRKAEERALQTLEMAQSGDWRRS